MRKPPTGEPYAGKPHVRFGGRGGETLPDPYQDCVLGIARYLWASTPAGLPHSLRSFAMTTVAIDIDESFHDLTKMA